MGEIVNVTPGWQCCLRCGRALTDRALHDRLEEPVLVAIRAEHPEWSDGDGACRPCVRHYRKLLDDRLTRDERLRASELGRIPRWVNRLLGRAESIVAKGEAVI